MDQCSKNIFISDTKSKSEFDGLWELIKENWRKELNIPKEIINYSFEHKIPFPSEYRIQQSIIKKISHIKQEDIVELTENVIGI